MFMKKTIFSLFFLTYFSVFSQDGWQSIDNHDVKFKFPIGYDFKETSNTKTYSFQDDEKIMSLSIFKNDAVKNLKTDDIDALKRYYEGLVDGYANKSGNKVFSRKIYKIQNHLAAKSLLKIVYPDGEQNSLEIHAIFINGLTYFASFQSEESPNQQTIDAKNIFFGSFDLKASIDTIKEEGEALPLTNNNSYDLGKTIGKITLYALLTIVTGIIIYSLFKKKKGTL